MNKRPITTLFMLTSVDGKITSGDTDDLDPDRDWRRIGGVKEGLQQYYDLEKQTDLCFLNTGRVFAKVGFNDRTNVPERIPVTGVLVDNKPHLTAQGLQYLSQWLERVIVATTNSAHPAIGMAGNIHVVRYEETIDFVDLFARLLQDFAVERVTIQSGGTLNAVLLREGLIDHLSLVVAPLLVGGVHTPSLVDGESLHTVQELGKMKALTLVSCALLKDSYLHIRYDVLPNTIVT